jgi:DNA-binding IclR family transcriptional regulator
LSRLRRGSPAFRAGEPRSAIRRKSYVVSRSNVTPVLVGIGVPIFAREEGRQVGSLARIMVAPAFREDLGRGGSPRNF